MIKLVRLDYRLLHGQIVFSWVNSLSAKRIIIVNDEAANSQTQKSILKLAKPAGVRLNVFTVEKTLKKFNQIKSLDENIILIFGNTQELLAFIKGAPEIKMVNYGATANKDGALQVGSSVFLDDAAQKDTQELLYLGVKIFIQQTPSHSKSDLTSIN